MEHYIKKFKESGFDISYKQFFEEITTKYKEIKWLSFFTKEPSRLDIHEPKFKPLHGEGLSFSFHGGSTFEITGNKSVSKVIKDDHQAWAQFDLHFHSGNILKIGVK